MCKTPLVLGVVLLLAPASALAFALPDLVPNFVYYESGSLAGNMYVNTDLLDGNFSPTLNGNDGLYSMKIPGIEALSTSPETTGGIGGASVVWQGDKWKQGVVAANGSEQWMNMQSLEDYPVNLDTNGADLLIATYTAGPHTWGTVEYGAVVNGSNFTGFTNVTTILPEPSILILMATAGILAGLAAVTRRWRRA